MPSQFSFAPAAPFLADGGLALLCYSHVLYCLIENTAPRLHASICEQ